VLEAARHADYITFTSSSTVRFFLEAVSPPGSEPPVSPATRIVSIGPITSGTLREHGLEPRVEAGRHDVDGIIDALLADAAGESGSATVPGHGAPAGGRRDGTS
jgi:uroporphyrinogen-III synthase